VFISTFIAAVTEGFTEEVGAEEAEDAEEAEPTILLLFDTPTAPISDIKFDDDLLEVKDEVDDEEALFVVLEALLAEVGEEIRDLLEVEKN